MNPLITDLYMISQRYKSYHEVSYSSCTWINGYTISNQKSFAWGALSNLDSRLSVPRLFCYNDLFILSIYLKQAQ